jgi:PAS domain S-box-containing protein
LSSAEVFDVADTPSADLCLVPAWDEAERVAALERYAILDTGREAAFDEVAELAADLLDAPIAVVNFIASDRQWFKAEVGIGQDELPLDVSICRHAILQPGVLIVPDLTKDARFAHNPLVTAAGGLRFYAGALLETPDGLPLGTVCVLDTKPRSEGVSERQARALKALATQTMAHLEVRRAEAIASAERGRAERRSRRLALLAEASGLLLRAPDPAAALPELFARVSAGFRLDVAFHYQCRAGGLGLIAAAGLTPEQERAAARIEFGHTVCGLVAARREAMHVTDIQTSMNEHASFLKALGIDSYYSAPLLAGGELLGTVSFGRKGEPFSPGELEALGALVGQLATALERRHAEAAARQAAAGLAEEAAAMRRLQEVGALLVQEDDVNAIYEHLLDAAAELMRADCASIQMLDRERGDLQLLAWRGFHLQSAEFWTWVDASSESSCGVALEKGERVVVADVETCAFMAGTGDLDAYRRSGIRAVQSTPLTSRSGEPVGMISTHWREPHEPSERDLRVFDLLARQAADIVERARAQAALRDSEARLRGSEAHLAAIFAQAAAGLTEADPSGRFLAVNDRYCEIVGRTREALLGLRMHDITHPEDLLGNVPLFEECVRTGTPFEIEKRYLRPDGSAVWVRNSVTTLRGADGALSNTVCVTIDITDRKRAEAELLELTATLERRVLTATAEREAALAQVHEMQKLETIGQLTGGVAHDFNNLLTPIVGSLDLLRRKLDDERSQRLIVGAQQSAERARTLISRLLTFARRQHLEPRIVDLAELAAGLEDLVARSIGPQVKVALDLAPDLPAVRVDPNQLELAVLNLAVNARDAMPAGGRLTIATDTAVADAEGALRLPPGRYVRLRVSDTGHGMDPETLRRAVEPFYSTKGVGKGTGLGLSMVHGLAAQSGGALELRSVPGEGTTATIWLPVEDGATPVAKPRSDDAVVRTRRLSVLLVDDEELVRTGTAEMLIDLGHEVQEAASGVQALELLRRRGGFDLVVTDYAMPGMSGAELAKAVRALHSALPVLMITGYASLADDVGRDLPRLAKPFALSDLARHLAAALDGPADEPRAVHVG